MTQLSNNVTRRLANIAVVPLSEIHFPEIWLLWKTQYEEEQTVVGAMPDTWGSYREQIGCFLRKRVNSDYVMVAKNRSEIIGYMFFDAFPFHKEMTAFCPIIGHAAKQTHRRQIFEKLYQALSKKLVFNGILNHVFTYFAHDRDLKETVFELGFGMIVMDAFRGLNTFPSDDSEVKIVQAGLNHLDIVKAIGEASHGYYLKAPLFLTREKQSREYYRNLLNDEDSAIFLAFSNNEPVGFMSIRKNEELDAITLCDSNTGLIDQIGAYIKPTYRGHGIGRALLLECIQWCQRHNIHQIHVDFESANLLARPFWLKYFTVAMHSVKRTIYQDISTPI